MATPLDLRNRRREAQRTVRLALNAVNSSLDIWRAALSEGKRHATELTNAILTLEHLPALPLGALADVPHLLEAAASKLLDQQRGHLLSLRASQDQLEGAAAGLAEAAASVHEVAELEAAEPLLGDRPVFTALPLPSISGMLREIERMHQAEVGVKRAVVQGFAAAGGAAEGRRGGGGGGGGGAGAGAGERGDALEARLQVHIAAWMLCTEVEEGRVAESLALLTEDANSV